MKTLTQILTEKGVRIDREANEVTLAFQKECKCPKGILCYCPKPIILGTSFAEAFLEIVDSIDEAINQLTP